MSLYGVVKDLVILPASLCLALIGSLIIMIWCRRVGTALLWGVAIIFYLLATPISAYFLSRSIATVPPLVADANLGDAKAIVVLAAGLHRNRPEYGGLLGDARIQERLAYAVLLCRLSQLPS